MNINNLKEGQTIKNYKELCSMLDEPIKTGKSKQLQLSDFERYFEYEKKGNKFIIKNIFSEPIQKEDGRIHNKGGNNSVYNEYIEKLIMHMLSSCPIDSDTKTINMSRNGLYLKLHMINQNYNYGRNYINKFSRYMEIPISTFYDFYNNTSGKLNSNAERTLNKLQNQCLIKWEYRIGVRLRTGGTRLAKDKEINKIVEIERKVLKELKEESKKDIFLKGKWNEFSSKVNEQLEEETPILYYYKVFHINTTSDFREMLLEAEDLETIQNELNATVYFSAIDTATKKHNNIQDKYRVNSIKQGIYYNKPKYESEQTQLRTQYITDTKAIAGQVIDYDTLKLNFDNISSEKYTLMEALCSESGEDWGIPFLDDAFEELFK